MVKDGKSQIIIVQKLGHLTDQILKICKYIENEGLKNFTQRFKKFRDVSRKFQGCFKKVSKVFQECFKKILRLSQESFKEV